MKPGKLFNRHAIAGLMALLLLVGLVGTVPAAEKPAIKFAPGATKATVKGEIQGMDRDTYPITAKAGQTLRVSVKNRLKLVLFRIQLPGGEEKYLRGAGESDDATAWKGALPVSGTYTIVVGAMRGDDTRYTMDVHLNP